MGTLAVKVKKNLGLFLQVARDIIAQGDAFIGPFMVFVVSCSHYAFFANGSSPLFILVAMIGLLFVIGFSRIGFFLASLFQLVFLAIVAVEQPDALLAQIGFLASLSVAFSATFVSMPKDAFLPNVLSSRRKGTPYTAVGTDPKEHDEQVQEILRQKERLWQQLFDARQEITRLYQQKSTQESDTPVSDVSYDEKERATKKSNCFEQQKALEQTIHGSQKLLQAMDAKIKKAYGVAAKDKRNPELFALLRDTQEAFRAYQKAYQKKQVASKALLDELFSLLP